jgi:hypothetical protein
MLNSLKLIFKVPVNSLAIILLFAVFTTYTIPITKTLSLKKQSKKENLNLTAFEKISDLQKNKSKLNGQMITLHHISLIQKAGEKNFWATDGDKLMLVKIPPYLSAEDINKQANQKYTFYYLRGKLKTIEKDKFSFIELTGTDQDLSKNQEIFLELTESPLLDPSFSDMEEEIYSL